jgi:tetratricopeptide (TPR) repeat protein
MADWEKIKDDFSKNEMDFDQFRDATLRFIWNNDKKALRQLCESQIVTPLFFTEKVIEEIRPGNEWNDVLFLMARELIGAAPDLVGHLKPALLSKQHLVRHPKGGKELLKPFVIMELSPDEFLEKVRLVSGTVNFMGLDELVRTNPNNTRSFIVQFLGQTINFSKDRPQSDLLELVKNKMGSHKSTENVGRFQIFTGRTVINDLEEEARQVRKLLAKGDYTAALSSYEKLLPKMDTIYANAIPMGGTEYPNALLFSGILLALNNKTAEAQKCFTQCMEKRYRFGDLLLLNIDALRENAATVRRALARLSADEPSHLAFEKFFEMASGHNYAEVNRIYDHFLEVVGDREMDKAFELSEQLLSQYHEMRNPLVPSSLCEAMVRIFRACHFAMQGDMAQAEQEYVLGAQGQVAPAELHRNFVKLAANPDKILDHYFGS